MHIAREDLLENAHPRRERPEQHQIAPACRHQEAARRAEVDTWRTVLRIRPGLRPILRKRGRRKHRQRGDERNDGKRGVTHDEAPSLALTDEHHNADREAARSTDRACSIHAKSAVSAKRLDSRTDHRARRLGGLRRSFVTGPAERPARKEAAMALRGKAIAASILLISSSAGGAQSEQSRRLSVNQ